jgi:hypothetical protein
MYLYIIITEVINEYNNSILLGWLLDMNMNNFQIDYQLPFIVDSKIFTKSSAIISVLITTEIRGSDGSRKLF